MKGNIKLLTFSAFLLAGSSFDANAALAQSTAGFSQGQIDGIKAILKETLKELLTQLVVSVNPQYVVSKSDEAEDMRKEFDEEMKNRGHQLESMVKTIEEKEQALRTMANTLSATAREKKMEEIVSLRAQGQQKANTLQEYANLKMQEIEAHLFKKMQEACEELLKEEGYFKISIGGIIAGTPAADISEKVIARMNKKYAEEKKKKAPVKPSQEKSK